MAIPFDQDRMEVTGRPVAITEGIAIRGGGGGVDLTISQDGTLWYGTGTSTGGDRQIVWVSRDGQFSEVDPGWVGDFRSLAISPDGTRLAVEQIGDGGRQVWVKHLDQARGPYSKLTLDFVNFDPAWHPDGREVTFVTRTGGASTLRTARADGSALPSTISVGDLSVDYAVWSPDGQWIVFLTSPEPLRDIYRVRATGDSIAEPLVVSGFQVRWPAVSPNGRWLAYVSNRTGAYELYVRPFASGDDWIRQVSNGGGWAPVWSHDGRELFYQNDSDELIQVQILPGSEFATGEQRVLFSLRGIHDWKTAPDGERFVMIRQRGADAPGGVVVVENFFAVLKDRTAR